MCRWTNKVRRGMYCCTIADGKVKIYGEDQVLRTSTLTRDSPDRGEEQGNLSGESEMFHHLCKTHRLMMVRHETIFGQFQRNYIYRHHAEPRVKLFVPREESFPIPLRYIDVTRATSKTFDVMLECRIDDIGTSKKTRIQKMRGRVSHGSPSPEGYAWFGVGG